jgi:hypothetical protein
LIVPTIDSKWIARKNCICRQMISCDDKENA